MSQKFTKRGFLKSSAMVLAVAGLPAGPAMAQVTAFKQSVAEAAARSEVLAQFYRERDFEGIWTGNSGGARTRRNDFLAALRSVGDHGLPTSKYDPDTITAQLRAATTPAQQGQMEVEMSRLFISYARDIQTGILDPKQVDVGGDHSIQREVPLRSRLGYLQAFAQSTPRAFLRALPPTSAEYTRLMRAKIDLERLLGQGGWGASVQARSLELGASGAQVVALRNRLIAMGFMAQTATQAYDANMQAGVQRFQNAHGLAEDGVAGRGTMAEVNIEPDRRLQNVIVALERERWLNRPLGARHIWVNLADFSTSIVDNGTTIFHTRSVVGADKSDSRSPEFSDVMEFMVINPSWYVPRSIATKQFLPQMQRNSNARPELILTDSQGRAVNRSSINFRSYTERTFPYSMRQAPSRGNALGLVKFMLPNRYNIYLHDTPAKNLFRSEVRAFSNGCIRLNDPFDFAYTLLSRQTTDPENYFQSRLASGREVRVDLEQPIPVHLVYRTAFTDAQGKINFRRDVYGRDGRIWNALASAGVAVRAIGS